MRSIERLDPKELGEIEAETRHDVKAVEYYLRKRVKYPDIVHILCTSEDINNLAYALTIKDAVEKVWLPAARRLVNNISVLAREQKGPADALPHRWTDRHPDNPG